MPCWFGWFFIFKDYKIVLTLINPILVGGGRNVFLSSNASMTIFFEHYYRSFNQNYFLIFNAK